MLLKNKKLRFSRKSCIFVLLATLICIAISISLLLIWPVSNENLPGVRIIGTPSSIAPDDFSHAVQVRNFLEGNGYCEPPCWFGLRAGKTKLDEVKYLYQIELDELVIKTALPTNPDSPFYRVYITDKVHGIGTEQTLNIDPQYGADEGVITSYHIYSYTWQRGADSYFAQVMKRYLLPSILNQLRAPDLVIVRASVFSTDLYTGNPYYGILLYYFEHGTMIEYTGDLEERGEQLQLCPSKGMVFEVNQWWPNERFSKEEIATEIQKNDIYISLEQATGMNLDTFYETFKDANSQVCLETPAKLWR